MNERPVLATKQPLDWCTLSLSAAKAGSVNSFPSLEAHPVYQAEAI
ncbi:hypothetical protein ACFL1V_05845 [Pseudomonadota bacterium]